MVNIKRLITLIIVVLIIVWVGFVFWQSLRKEKPKSEEEKIKDQILEAISSYKFSISEFETIEKIKTFEEKAILPLADLINDPKKETRYIAFIALSGLTNQLPEKRSEIISYLKTGLTDSDPTIRVQVAQLVLIWGEKDALPVLIEALDSKEIMVPSEPMTPLAFYAHLILTQHTEQDFGFDKTKWQNWWQENKDLLNWNKTTEKFES